MPEGLDFACDIACRWKAQYMLAWSGDNGMRGSVIHADGTVDEPEEVSYGGGNGALAAGDPNLFFAWQAPSDKYPGYQDLFGRLVGQTKPRAVLSTYPESGNSIQFLV